jgi:hypothetical protein
MVIKLELELDEVNGVLAALGELPAKTGAWNLIVKIQDQAKPQVPPPAEEAPVEEVKPAE